MQGANLVLTSYQDNLMRAMDVVANNIANTTTTGFKRQEVAFDSLVSRPVIDQEFVFAVDRGSYRDTQQGPLIATGNDLDVAIQGAGYFPIQTKSGTRYTRAGTFQLNSQGQMVTANGDLVLGDGGQPITMPDNTSDLSISGDGMINVAENDGTRTEVGRLRVVKFNNEQALRYIGNNMYAADEAAEPDDNSRLMQGMVEQSNAQSVTEMTHMINIMRSYQLAVHLLEQDDQRLSNAISRLSKTTA